MDRDIPASAAPCARVDASARRSACAQSVPNVYTHTRLNIHIDLFVYYVY